MASIVVDGQTAGDGLAVRIEARSMEPKMWGLDGQTETRLDLLVDLKVYRGDAGPPCR